jgi:hypothetical protein
MPANCSEGNLTQWLEDIRTGIKSQMPVVEHYQTPQSTIENKLKDDFNFKPGCPTVFSPDEEDAIVGLLKKEQNLVPQCLNRICISLQKTYLGKQGRLTQFKNEHNMPGYFDGTDHNDDPDCFMEMLKEICYLHVLYKAEHLWTIWTENGSSGHRYDRTKSGRFDVAIFEDLFLYSVSP